MKPWYKSKIIWTNIGAFVGAIVPILGTQLGDIIGNETALQITAVIGLLNAMLQVGLRIFVSTSTSITAGPV